MDEEERRISLDTIPPYVNQANIGTEYTNDLSYGWVALLVGSCSASEWVTRGVWYTSVCRRNFVEGLKLIDFMENKELSVKFQAPVIILTSFYIHKLSTKNGCKDT
jgi:hypothetical protein